MSAQIARERKSDSDLRAEDAQARRLAQIEFSQPLVLEAGAGTGKTTTLVARIVAFAMGPGWERAVQSERVDLTGAAHDERAERIAAHVLSRISAMTFTEAAAAEMAERVGRTLVGLASGEFPNGLTETALPGDEAVRERRARALVGALDHLGVRTIHAWCRRLLARNPIEARVHPAFEVDADEEVQAAAIRECVERTLRKSLTERRGAVLLELAAAGIGPEHLEAALATLVSEGIAPRSLERDPWTTERIQAAAAEVDAGLDGLLTAEGGLLAGVGGTNHALALESVGSARAALRADPPRDSASAARFVASLGSWDPRAVERIRDWSGGKFNKGERAALGAQSEDLAAAAARLLPLLRHWRECDPELFGRARVALAPLLAEVVADLRARGVLTFADLLRKSRDLLATHASVLRRTRRELDMLLVDELQDTDPIQCDIIRMLALQGSPEERPSLFLVGDPKQSIYGWRSADLRAYEGLVSEVCGGGGGALHRLSVNFRSVPAILEEVERLVAPVMREQPAVQPSFQRLLPSLEKHSEPGFASGRCAPVEHWVSWSWDHESGCANTGLSMSATTQLESRALAAELASLHREGEVAWSDVAVLFRNHGDLEAYLEAFRDAGVPYAVERDRSYFLRREVIEAAAAVRCVLDPNDVLALLTLLRSASVGVPDAALIPLWAAQFPQRMSELLGPDAASLETLAQLVHAAAEVVPHDVPGLERIDGWVWNLLAAIESLALLRRDFEFGASDRFVERLRRLMLMDATEAGRYLGRYRAANLERFFRELGASLAGGGDPHAMLRRLRTGVADRREAEEGRPQDEETDAVRIMTVHKAKGLDFSHVYLPQLHKGSPNASSALVQAGELDGVLEFRLFGLPTPGFYRLGRERAAVEAAERVRALYVAATRAEHRLVLMGRWKSAPAPLEPEHARSMLDLLRSRSELPGNLEDLMSQLASRGGDASWADLGGARWRFPALESVDDPAIDPYAAPLPDAGEVRAQAERVAERRRSAAQRMSRPRSSTASALHAEEDRHEDRESRAALAFAGSTSSSEDRDRSFTPAGAERQSAMAVGTAIHRVLEDWDLSAPPSEELRRQRARLDSLLVGATGVGVNADAAPGVVAAAERAHRLLARFAAGPLLERFRALQTLIVARELAVLRAPDEKSVAVAYESGIIDLVYRDPETQEMIVVDYKTDRVASEEEIRRRADAYRAQGEFYCLALADALDLERPPQFELWFLDADHIERLPQTVRTGEESSL